MNFEQQMEALRLRLEALTMNLELASRDQETFRERSEAQARKIDALLKVAEQDGENIRALARIAESRVAS